MPQSPALRFLIVDPLEGVRVFTQRLLAGFGFQAAQLRGAADPVQALQLCQDWLPDFLLTDAFARQQPDGIALFQQLRARQPQCQLGLTGFQLDGELQARARALGASFVLAKPFGPELLRDELQRALTELGRRQPGLAQRLAQESRGRLDGQRRIELPRLPPPLKVGDRVRFKGRAHRVQAVVIRHGEQLAQLEGLVELQPVDRLSR